MLHGSQCEGSASSELEEGTVMAKSNSFILLVAAATALMQCWQALLSYTTELSAVWLPDLWLTGHLAARPGSLAIWLPNLWLTGLRQN